MRVPGERIEVSCHHSDGLGELLNFCSWKTLQLSTGQQMLADNSVKVLRDQHGFSLWEVEDDYTKTTATHPSQGRGCETKFTLLHSFENRNLRKSLSGWRHLRRSSGGVDYPWRGQHGFDDYTILQWWLQSLRWKMYLRVTSFVDRGKTASFGCPETTCSWLWGSVLSIVRIAPTLITDEVNRSRVLWASKKPPSQKSPCSGEINEQMSPQSPHGLVYLSPKYTTTSHNSRSCQLAFPSAVKWQISLLPPTCS